MLSPSSPNPSYRGAASPFGSSPPADQGMEDADRAEAFFSPFSPLFDNELSTHQEQNYQHELQGTTNSADYDFDLTSGPDDVNNFLPSPITASTFASNPADRLDHYLSQRSGDPWFAGRSNVDGAPLALDTARHTEYREPAPSDAASSIITGPQPDSGYKTSDEPSAFNQEIPLLQAGFDDLKPGGNNTRMSSVRLLRNQGQRRGQHLCTWADCGASFRLKSDLKKHHLRHTKPHRCDTCTKGFATTNDLERHQKTVHQNIQRGAKAWRCVYPSCRSSNKIWPRQDNFRAHVKQHCEETAEIDQIVENSEFIYGSYPASLPAASPGSSSSREPYYSLHSQSTSQQGSVDQRFSPRSSVVGDSYSSSFFSTTEPLYNTALAENQRSHNTLQSPNATNFIPFPSSPPFSVSSPWPPSDSYGAPLLSPSSAITCPIPRSRNPRIQKHNSSRSISAHREPRRVSEQLSRYTRSDKVLGIEKPIVIQELNDSQSDMVPDDTNLMEKFESIIKSKRTEAEQLQALQDLKTAQRSNRLDPSISSFLQSRTSSRGRRSPAPDRIIIETNRANNSRGGSRKSRSTEGGMSLKLEASSQPSECNESDLKFPCLRPGCTKSFPRRSALEKHIRRHDKPYACTFDACNCSKAFGSKNDWKRHENSRHHQPELWRCEFCRQTFPTEESFSLHVRNSHNVGEGEELVAYCKVRRIGGNHAETYWCGFCRQIISIDPSKKGVEAWDERYNHIAAHFVPDKDRKTQQHKIEDWLPPDGHQTKGEKEAQLSGTEPADMASSSFIKSPVQVLITSADGHGAQSGYSASSSRPQPAVNLRTRSPKRKRSPRYSITCCRCGDETDYWTLNCMLDSCFHRYCENCRKKVLDE